MTDADDQLREACGVFALHAPGRPADQSVAQLTYLGLFALQHRGQEAAGMAVSDGEQLTVVKDQGLVASVFGMNVHFPGEGSPGAFWIILVTMLVILSGMVLFFRRRGWL